MATTRKFNGRSYKISPLKEGPYKKGLVKNLMKARREVKVALNKKDKALEDKYTAQISAADATIKIYLDNSVGIGEHPQHIEEIDKLLQKIVDAQEKLKELQAFKL